MEGQPAKRRRVYSIEPNKVVEAIMFTRNYLNYLVPALMKIKERSSKQEQHNNNNKINCDVVKHEVDMAMVISAQGFAWSNALKTKLQQQREEIDDEGNSSRTKRIHDGDQPCSKFSKYKDMKGLMKMDSDGEEKIHEDDDFMNSQLVSLRRLIPGGEEMCKEQMVGELESYISCLQMQVNILQYLAGMTTS